MTEIENRKHSSLNVSYTSGEEQLGTLLFKGPETEGAMRLGQGSPARTRPSETLQLSMPHLFHKKDVGEQMHIVEVDI